jgi:quinol monooxygenase YgiN
MGTAAGIGTTDLRLKPDGKRGQPAHRRRTTISGDSNMIIVLAHVQVTPGRLPEALALAKVHVARSRAEPGCLSHAVYEDPDREHHLVFVEQWESEAALQRHFSVPQSAAFVNHLGVMAAVRPKIRLYNATELPFPLQGKP